MGCNPPRGLDVLPIFPTLSLMFVFGSRSAQLSNATPWSLEHLDALLESTEKAYSVAHPSCDLLASCDLHVLKMGCKV